jgi:hypothetical protein
MNINELRDKIKETNKLVSEHAKEALDKAFTDIFNKYPEVIGFKWQQYIPSFNDGDPCTFSVYDPDYILYTKEFADKITAEDLASTNVYVYEFEDVEDNAEDSQILEDSGLEAEQVRSVSFYRDYNGGLDAADKEIKKLFSGDVEDIFEEAYGDGYTIIATKKGLTVVEYEEY